MRNIHKPVLAGAIAAMSAFLFAAPPAAAECLHQGGPAGLLVEYDAPKETFKQRMVREQREIRQTLEDRKRSTTSVASDASTISPPTGETIQR